MSMSSSDCIRSISTTGIVAAPVTANRSERQVVVAALGVVQQRLVDRRRPGQHGDPVFLHRAHRLLGVERQLRDQRRAGLQAGQDARLVAEVVEERVDAQVAVGAGDLPARRPRRGRVERLPVCAQHALAAAGGAGREQDVGDVVGLRRRRRGARPRRRSVAAGDELVPGAVVLVDRDAHDVAQRGQAGRGRGRRPCRRRGTRRPRPAAALRCGPGCRRPRLAV